MPNKKTVVIIDAGGRGSALVDAYSRSSQVGKIIAIPGNDLMPLLTSKKVKTFPELKTTSIDEIVEICKKEKADLVDVAQDNAVAAGLANILQAAGFNVIGPTKEAGQIEWDKGWSRDFMKKYGLPIPEYKVFSSEKEGAEYLKKSKDRSWYIKASGLAEGKGVIPADTNKEAMEAIKEMGRFGNAGSTYLLEEWLIGEEFSAFALCDGKDFLNLGYAQDHKRVNNFDMGENTGGMGCVSPPAVVNSNIKNQIAKILKTTLEGLRKEGRPYVGVLYLGGIIVDGEVKIIEFNSRWGDPEIEVIAPGIKSDFFKLMMATVKGKVRDFDLKMDGKYRIGVAGASRGYPRDYSPVKGKQIFGLSKLLKSKNVRLYGAGVKADGKKFLASGGRLFYVVAEGNDVIEARENAYSAMAKLHIEGNNLHYRTDIGWRDMDRISKN